MGAFLQAVFLVVAGLVSWDRWSLLAAFLALGIGWAFFNTIGWMWVPVHIKKGTAAAILSMSLFFAFGNMVGPLAVGSLLAAGVTWRWVLAGEGVASLMFGLAFLRLAFADIPGRENLRASQVKEVGRFNPGLVASMLIASFLYVGVETSITVWLTKSQIDIFGAGADLASLSVTLFWVGVIGGRLIAIPASRRFSPSRIVVVCGAGLAVFSVALAYAPTQSAAFVLAFGAGLAASATFGLVGSYASKFPLWYAGVVSSTFLLLGGAGSMVIPYLMGPLADNAGFRVAISMLAIPALAYALLALFIHSKSGEGKPRTATQPDESEPADATAIPKCTSDR